MMWSQAPSFASAVTAAVLCLLATAPHAARACVADNDRCCMLDGVGVCESTEVVCVNNNRCRPCGGLNEFECIVDGDQVCDDGFIAFSNGRCRPCGVLGAPPCEDIPSQSAPGCQEGLTVNASGRCRPCGASDGLPCVADDGSRFCTGDRLVVLGDRCRPCGSVGRSACEDGTPCDGTLLPAADDGGACRPCGARFRSCCAPDAGVPVCRSAAQECVDGLCLRCGLTNADDGCPGSP